MKTIIKNKFLIYGFLIILTIAVFFSLTYILSLGLCLYKRFTYSDQINISSISFKLPKKWWIQSIENNERIIIARIPTNLHSRILFLAIINDSYNPICSNIYKKNDHTNNNSVTIPKKLIIPAVNDTLFDVYWLYPSLNICIVGIKYKKEEIIVADELANKIMAIQ